MILRHLRVLYCALFGLITLATITGLQMATTTSPPNAAISRRPAPARGWKRVVQGGLIMCITNPSTELGRKSLNFQGRQKTSRDGFIIIR
jgi:hypothetical protein